MLLSGQCDTRAPRAAIRAMSASSSQTACTSRVRSSRRPAASSRPTGVVPCAARMRSTSARVSAAWTWNSRPSSRQMRLAPASVSGEQVRGEWQKTEGRIRGQTPEPGAAEPPRGREVAGGVRDPRRRVVDHPLAEDRAQPDGFHRLGHRVLVEVAVRAGGRPGQEHLHAGEQRPAAGGRGVQDRGLGREDVLPQPALERQVVRQAAEERHGQVGVGVDQPGHEDAAAGVDDLRGPRGGGHAAQRRDGRTPHPEPARGDDLAGRVAGEDEGVLDEGVVHRAIGLRPRPPGAGGDGHGRVQRRSPIRRAMRLTASMAASTSNVRMRPSCTTTRPSMTTVSTSLPRAA